MIRPQPALVLLFLFAFAAAEARIVPSADGDATALLDFKDKLGGGVATLLSWNQSTHFCTWQGVTCSRRHPERVTAIDLPAGGFVGPISPSVGNLSFLRSINLSSNALNGEIPSSIGRLRRLRDLDLSSNSIGGEIPMGMSNCSELRYIDLYENLVVGSIPPWLGSFTRLAVLNLGKNNITGVIPASLTNASSLLVLVLYLNHIEDIIPEGLGHLTHLRFLQLSGNNISDTIPTSLYNVTSLRYFAAAGNQLNGRLPADIGSTLSNLQVLLLGQNQFTGQIPASITNCSGLRMLAVSYNDFSGHLPAKTGRLTSLTLFSMGVNHFEAQTAEDWNFLSSLTNCSYLQQVFLDHNYKLGGVLPSAVANLSERLQVLNVGGNAISGSIPSGIGNLVGLERLVLYENNFTGNIPEGIGHLRQLQWLTLDENNLSGKIPSSVGNLTQLYYLTAPYNTLQGPIPATIRRLQSLTFLGLSNNFLYGAIPEEVANLTFLSDTVDLRFNLLTGSLPSDLGNLKNMENFFVSGNRLQGQIPSTLGDCQVLEYLALDDNFFRGSIPSALGNLAGLKGLNLTKNNLTGEIPQALSFISDLQELYLSHNELSGAIPESLQNLSSLFSIDLSFNHLEGSVPTKGVFSNITRMSIVGNDGLCGGSQSLHLPACPTQPHGRRRSISVPLAVAIPTLCFCFFLAIVSVLVYCRKKNKKIRFTSSTSPFDGQYPIISYAELSRSTAGFDAANLIGRGRFGSVYKATLEHDNRTMAVKVFDLQQSGSSRSFLAECEALSRIRHRNLVKIITCCSSIDSNGDDFKALVFDFMANKSLDRWLHPQLEDDSGEHEEVSNLSLKQRLNIAIDVTEALDYLHNQCDPPIVHCDLKPSNILLDEDMVAHVGDFGLAKLLPEAISRSFTDSTNSIGLKGSIGYVPPEYAQGSPVAVSGDVYSFGILLLELLSGKSPVDEMFKEGLTLRRFVEMRGAMEIVDPALLLHDNGTIDWWNSVEECSTSLARIGLACTEHAPRDRMCMAATVAQLRAAKNVFVRKIEITNETQNQ